MNWLGFNLKSIYSAFILKDICAEYKILGWQFFFSGLTGVTVFLFASLWQEVCYFAFIILFIIGFQQCGYAVPWCSFFLFVVFLHVLCCEINEPLGSVGLQVSWHLKIFWPVLQIFFLSSLSFWRDSIYIYVRSLDVVLWVTDVMFIFFFLVIFLFLLYFG